MKKLLALLAALAMLLAALPALAEKAEKTPELTGDWRGLDLVLNADGTARLVATETLFQTGTWSVSGSRLTLDWDDNFMRLFPEHGWFEFSADGDRLSVALFADQSLVFTRRGGAPADPGDLTGSWYGMTFTFFADGTMRINRFGQETPIGPYTLEDGLFSCDFMQPSHLTVEGDTLTFSGDSPETESVSFTRVPASGASVDASGLIGSWKVVRAYLDGAPFPAVNITVTFSEDGTCTNDNGYSVRTAPWTLTEAGLFIDGQLHAYTLDGDTLLLNESGIDLEFVRADP